MRRIALAAVLAATMAPAAHATHDRSDPIPTSVGPSDARGYRVNATANLPAGITSERWLNVAQRSLQRWGATYLGPTTLSPDDHDDKENVIGFSTSSELAQSVVGLNTKSKGGRVVTPGGGTTCAVAPNMGTTQTVTDVPTVLRLRLRSDRVRKGKVRRRTVTATRTLTAPRVDSAPVNGQRCIDLRPGTESDPASVYAESDVQLDATLGSGWFAGPGVPPGDRLDLETVLLHELGHAAGLGHQPQDCDPSSPMRAASGGGDYWRGLDEVLFTDCTKPYPVTPDPPHGTEAPFTGGTLGGRAFHVNPAVPNGYDRERFIAVARNAIERWGGVYAGTSDAKPAQGDGTSVIGFDTIARTQYEVTTRSTTERLTFPAYRTCTLVSGRVASYRVKKVIKRVRVRGKKRKVRRDRVVKTTVSGPASGACTDHAAEARTDTTVETDVGIAHEMDAYELGPTHPVLQTKVDMATMLASALGQAAGVAPGPCGTKATPVTVEVLPGDWWHTPEDVNRVPCPAPGRAVARTPETSDDVRYVRVQE